MRFFSLAVGSIALAISGFSNGINILMSNDDGFGSANLRQLSQMLLNAGHDVYIVAPATQQSGEGGRVVFTSEANLTAPAQFDLIPTGAPSVGPDPPGEPGRIWYYNGTPAACVFVGLDHVLPNFANFSVPDLVVTGPNFGTNLGPFVWTLSGTAGAAYAATARSIPAIAISGSNDVSPYYTVNSTSDPAYRVASVSFKIINGIIKSTPRNHPILPLGYGININIPPLDEHWNHVPIVHTRMTGGADVDQAVPGKTPGTFTWANISPRSAGANQCINGDCNLPGETDVVAEGKVSLSVYSVDYTAPTNRKADEVRRRLEELASRRGGGGDGSGRKGSAWRRWKA